MMSTPETSAPETSAPESSAEQPAPQVAQAQPDNQTEQRRLAANVAARLLDQPSESESINASTSSVDWQALHQAPDWLAIDTEPFTQLQYRLGAILFLPQIRLWIDQPRVTAAGDLVGQDWLRQCCTDKSILPMPFDEQTAGAIDDASAVAPALRNAGATVMIAAMEAGALREALALTWSIDDQPTINAELARSLINRAQR